MNLAAERLARVAARLAATSCEELGYELQLSPMSTDDAQLVVVFSFSGRPMLTRRRFPGTILHAVDRDNSYFVANPAALADLLAGLAKDYDRIALVGASKGGFGALLIGALLSQRIDRAIEVRAASPQVQLWPRNDRLIPSLASYASLLARAEADPPLMAALEQFGALPPFLADAGASLHARIAFGTKHRRDRGEMRLIAGLPAVEPFPIKTRTHFTLGLLATDDSSRVGAERLMVALLRHGAEDADVVSHLLNERLDRIVDDIMSTGIDPARNRAFWRDVMTSDAQLEAK